MKKISINEAKTIIRELKREKLKLVKETELTLDFLANNPNHLNGQELYNKCKENYIKIKNILIEEKFYEIQIKNEKAFI